MSRASFLQEPGRSSSAFALFLLPLLFCLMFVMHFGKPADFFHFQLHYTPRDPADVVRGLVRAHNRWPLYRDPHVLGYLTLPLLPLCGYGLYLLSRVQRPVLSGLALFLTVTGTIYLGGIMGMWTAFYRGLGNVDPQYTEGAIATFRGMTSPHGAFLLTTMLGKLAMVGLALQALSTWKVRNVPVWASLCVAVGCAMFLLFWDLDNWMLLGSALMLSGFVPMLHALRQP